MKAKQSRIKLASFMALAAFSVSAQTGSTNLSVKAGAEMWLRYDLTDNLPTAKRGESDYSSYARVRPREGKLRLSTTSA